MKPDKEALRQQIHEAYTRLGACLKAFETAPEGTFDIDDDIDIIGNLVDFWIMENAERDGALFDEVLDQFSRCSSVKQ